ncbi:MAG: aspartate carbamoyltransferase catalytic subunit [Myxococcota bacterium]|jgi:aspartate carbamoyltransferase catalytic subunit|nr:aspartate carbamoyltransferase catalytic subunit [Myxococcota bacterium]
MTEPQLRHLLSISDLSRTMAEQILKTAQAFHEIGKRPVRKVPTLRGKTVINVFYEASTRTRTSFELAGKRLSADVVNIGGSSSSTSKGESLRDTVLTLDAMHASVIVLRHAVSGAAHYVARNTRAAVVNAGDGMHEHPTQALLDVFTIRQHKGTDLAGLTVTICGDIQHSRVARSNVQLLRLLGARVRLAGPRTLLPHRTEALGVETFDRLEPALEGADVVMMLRIQRERLGAALFPSSREYARYFGLNARRLALANPEAIVMHPGPINRGVEISDDVADGPHSVILGQVEAGVAVRMAVLYFLASEPGAEPTPA